MSNDPVMGRRPVLLVLGLTMIAAASPAVARIASRQNAPKVLVFDVAESLLDLNALRPFFAQRFGDGALVDEWFGQTILYSETATLTNGFVPFGTLAASVLKMLARIHKVPLGDADLADFGKGLATLPPHPDVAGALKRLKGAGYRMVTLTDTPASPGKGALHAAGLEDMFEQQFTAETVKRYKPAHEGYAMVARALGVDITDLCMIASHPWDLIGARAAGCSAALIQRPGVALLELPGIHQPQIVAPTLGKIADRLVDLKRA